MCARRRPGCWPARYAGARPFASCQARRSAQRRWLSLRRRGRSADKQCRRFVPAAGHACLVHRADRGEHRGRRAGISRGGAKDPLRRGTAAPDSRGRHSGGSARVGRRGDTRGVASNPAARARRTRHARRFAACMRENVYYVILKLPAARSKTISVLFRRPRLSEQLRDVRVLRLQRPLHAPSRPIRSGPWRSPTCESNSRHDLDAGPGVPRTSAPSRHWAPWPRSRRRCRAGTAPPPGCPWKAA